MNLNFADHFKHLRKEKGVTQEKIAEILDVSSQSISRWELGMCYPDVELLPTIANYFGVTVDSLLSNDSVSKERDRDIFLEKIDQLPDSTSARIDFVREYCRKYPEVDFYAFHLVKAIKRHVVGDEAKTQKYMPLLLKTAERLLETRYRSAVIQLMATVCDEKDLDKWLDMAPYSSGFSRRYCLVARAMARDNGEGCYIQQGLEALERFANQLDRRCPDVLGAERKTAYQRDILKIIRSFGEGGEIPDGWKMFYAYKQLVLAACLFGHGQVEDGWRNFDEAIETCKYAQSLTDEWLEIGGELFSGIKVSRDWNYAIDAEGERHKLFALMNLSFHDMTDISDLLTNPRWAWFDCVRETEKYQAAARWATQKADEWRAKR